MRHLLIGLALATISSTLSAQTLANESANAPAVRDSSLVLTASPAALHARLAPAPPPLPLPAPNAFAKSGFAQFMSSPAGRVLRAVAGAGMIAGGLAADSDGGKIVAAVGVVPLVAGTFDVCFLSPLFGGPFTGKAIRAAK
jgi:hypothetical protein